MVFSTTLVYLPLYLLCDLPLLPPFQSKRTVYTDSVWLWGGGVLSCVVDLILLQEFNALFLTRFRTYKIATPPQNQKSKWPVKTTFRDWCLKVPSSMTYLYEFRGNPCHSQQQNIAGSSRSCPSRMTSPHTWRQACHKSFLVIKFCDNQFSFEMRD